jgi:hypothetical protein
LSDDTTKDMQRHIQERIAAHFETARIANIARRRIHGDKQKANTTLELFLDQWSFENGPITQTNFLRAVMDAATYAESVIARKNQNEWDASNGGLDF